MSTEDNDFELFQSVSKEEFEKLQERPVDSIVEALRAGRNEQRAAEAAAVPPTIDAKLRFA